MTPEGEPVGAAAFSILIPDESATVTSVPVVYGLIAIIAVLSTVFAPALEANLIVPVRSIPVASVENGAAEEYVDV